MEVQRKIVILGFRAVGKTALATQFCEGKDVFQVLSDVIGYACSEIC